MAKRKTIEPGKEVNDAELVRGCVDEDRQCQALLYRKYANKMFAVCLRYCNTREEAEDVLQDAFVKIFDRISTFRGDGPLEGWIRRVMVNTALKSRDKRRMKFESGDIEQVDEPHIDEQVMGNIQVRNLLGMVSDLPEGYKMVFNLYAVEGYSHKEIGDMLGITESTSRSQFSRARKILIDRVLKDSTS